MNDNLAIPPDHHWLGAIEVKSSALTEGEPDIMQLLNRACRLDELYLDADCEFAACADASDPAAWEQDYKRYVQARDAYQDLVNRYPEAE